MMISAQVALWSALNLMPVSDGDTDAEESQRLVDVVA